MTYENYHKLLESIAEEQDCLMKEHHIEPKSAWQLGLQKVAEQLAVDADELKTVLWEYIRQLRQELKPIPWESIADPQNQQDLAHREYWHKQPEKFEAVLKILFQQDSIGICNHDTGASQYSIVVNTILHRLEKIDAVEDVHKVIHEELVYWFNATGERSANKYEAIAKEIWELIQGKR